MSLAVVKSRAMLGMTAPTVTVEVHLANGLPAFNIVGLPEVAVRESKDRVRAAILNAQLEFPNKKITVNLAPADLPKASGRFDLPIALGILLASGQLQVQSLLDYEFAGELSLSGQLRPIQGALALAYGAQQSALAENRAPPIVLLPADNCAEAALVTGVRVRAAHSLLDVCAQLRSPEQQVDVGAASVAHAVAELDWSDVRGQLTVKRALEVAASGGHSVLLMGPPGTGKSMLAARLPSILPLLSESQAIESAAVHSSVGQFKVAQWRRRPFRSPHHTSSVQAIVGGGAVPKPGEISLAHHGVLFLDELPQFQRNVLEALREPLETGEIHIARATRHDVFPARFQFVGAMNPCPCGYLGHPTQACRCTPDVILRYQSRLSGPFLNRIDMQVEVPVVAGVDLSEVPRGESSAVVAERVQRAVQRQMTRQGVLNAHLNVKQVDEFCALDDAARQLLLKVMAQLNWSARVYHRILRVARTIADLEGAVAVASSHVAQAIQYRRALKTE
ncbi:MAG: YifB family Mg chelatase-like AAA ATPase [Formosimonas sp.]